MQAEGARDSLITSQSLIAARLRLKSSERPALGVIDRDGEQAGALLD